MSVTGVGTSGFTYSTGGNTFAPSGSQQITDPTWERQKLSFFQNQSQSPVNIGGNGASFPLTADSGNVHTKPAVLPAGAGKPADETSEAGKYPDAMVDKPGDSKATLDAKAAMRKNHDDPTGTWSKMTDKAIKGHHKKISIDGEESDDA